MESTVELGRKYRDTITGFTGTAIARFNYLHGCERICLQAEWDGATGDKPSELTVDAPQLVEEGTNTPVKLREPARTGGPQDDSRAARPAAPTR